MNRNKFINWDTIKLIPREVYLHGLYDDHEGLRLMLNVVNVEGKMLKINFSTYLGYRTTEETSRLKTLHLTPINEVLNKTIDSEYLKWIAEESSAIFDEMQLSHYLICCSDAIVDIISMEEPQIE